MYVQWFSVFCDEYVPIPSGSYTNYTHTCLSACLFHTLDYKPLAGRGLSHWPLGNLYLGWRQESGSMELSKCWLMCDSPQETASVSRRWYILSLLSRNPKSDQGQVHKKLNNCSLIPKICKSHHRKHLWKELILFAQPACSWKTVTLVCWWWLPNTSFPFIKFVKDKHLIKIPVLLLWFSRLTQNKHGWHLRSSCLPQAQEYRYFESFHFQRRTILTSYSRKWDIAFIFTSWMKNLLSYNNVTLYWKFRMLLFLFLKGKVLGIEKIQLLVFMPRNKSLFFLISHLWA